MHRRTESPGGTRFRRIASKETVPAEKGKDKENDEESKSLARQNLLNARFRFQQLKVVD